jgi:hypothetical protein
VLDEEQALLDKDTSMTNDEKPDRFEKNADPETDSDEMDESGLNDVKIGDDDEDEDQGLNKTNGENTSITVAEQAPGEKSETLQRASDDSPTNVNNDDDGLSPDQVDSADDQMHD